MYSLDIFDSLGSVCNNFIDFTFHKLNFNPILSQSAPNSAFDNIIVWAIALCAFSALFSGLFIFYYLKYKQLSRINSVFKKKLRSLIRERDIGGEYYKLIAENTSDVVWVYDLENSVFSFISPSVEKFRGISTEKAIKQTLAEKFTPKSYQELTNQLDNIRDKSVSDIREPLRFEGEQVRSDGTIFTSETFAVPIFGKNGKITALKGVTHDISKQKQTEHELRSTERRLIDALENSKQILYRINYNTGYFEYISPYFIEITGLELEDDRKLRIEDFINIVHPEDRFMLEGRDFTEADFSEESKLSFMREFRICLKENEYHWFSDWTTLVFDTHQKALANVGSLYDIDERMGTESALRESESRFKTLAENSNDIIARYNRDFKHIFVNSSIENIFPFNPDYFLGKSFRELEFPEKFCNQWEDSIEEVFTTKQTIKGDIVFKGEKTDYHLNYKMYPEYDEFKNVTNVIVNIHDVTDEKRTLNELNQIGLEYKLLFEYAHDAIFIEDSEENILNANKSAVRLFGYTKDELLNMKTSDIVSPDMKTKGAHSLYTDPYSTEDRSFETYLISKNGKRIAANVALATFYVAGKRVIMSMVRDITSKKEAELALKNSEGKYRTLFETIKDGIIQTDLEGRIIDINDAFKKMLGYSVDDVKDLRYFDLIPEKWQNHIKNTVLKQVMRNGFSDETEKAFIHKEGHNVPVLCRAWLVKGENGKESTQMWGLIRDITESKKAEKELQLAKDEAERASKVKGDFLANMSHEIRTPMNGVIGMCNLLLRTDLNEEQQDYADSIRISADNLLKIINDILDISKIEAGKLELDVKEINLKKWLRRTNNIIAIKAQEKGLKLESIIENDVPLVVYGDHLRLSQVVINLVSNAVKFTEKGGVKLIISKGCETDENVELKFTIKDTGIGIASDKIDQIFKSFSQVDTSAKRRYSGTGLGLAISKNITELMGGKIGVNSEINQGSEFWFTAKLKKNRKIDSQEDIFEFMKKLKILILDDGSPDGFIIRDQLTLLNCKFDEVSNTDMAIDTLEKSYEENDLFKAVLVDSSLGDEEVEEFTSRVKSHPHLHNIVLILMKALGSRIRKHKENKSFSAILPKPIKYDELNETLVSQLILNTPELMETTTVGLQDTHRLKDLKEELNIKAELSPKKKSDIKILLAEDNLINQKLALRIITKLGYSVNAVENGMKAIEELAQNEYQLVFMDIQMPVMDGVEATRRIRSGEANTNNSNIPIIAMTAHAMKGDKEKFLNEGMTDYISKPIDISLLTELLEKYTR